MSNQISPEELKQQVEAYVKELPHYEIYAQALKRVLEKACLESIPGAIVQVRPKSKASFAEKCVRKYDKYPDAVNQMTDLCGGRIIIQTLEQIKVVKLFIEKNFNAFDPDDKSSLLGEDKFGYRDMHYLVRLKPERASVIGFTPRECQTIGSRVAELQVRSVVQHAWADILHDRIYKAPLKLSTEAKRTGALLAAIMEDGDRNFDQLAGQLDGMAANYSAYASRENVEKEIRTQELLLKNANDMERPIVALKIARLIAAKGEWKTIITLLQPHQDLEGPLKEAIRLELGHALCRLHRSKPQSASYHQGQELLQQVVKACENPDFTAVPNLRRNRSIHSRALARLGWSWEPLDAEAYQARECYCKAVELEPNNPYYLADMLGFELKFAAGTDLVAGFRASIKSALIICREHAITGTELPAAFFTAARLNMLMGNYYAALNDYACGVRHWLNKEGCMTCNLLEDEIAWLHRVHSGKALPEEFRWAEELLLLVQSINTKTKTSASPSQKVNAPVLIITGGTASLKPENRGIVELLLQEALAAFSGTVISGGSTSGVPGFVGKIAGDLARMDRKGFKLIGYIPKSFPNDAEKDKHYDKLIDCGSDKFTPAQVLWGWKDVFDAGIKPTDVLLLGFGGGKIAAFEYRLALALSAPVGVIHWEKDSAEELLKDPLWSSSPKLYPLPHDPKTIRAFVVRDGYPFGKAELSEMAKEFHARYQAENTRKIKPDNLKPWDDLPDTYKKANLEQANYAIRILQAAGFGVRKVKGRLAIFNEFTAADVELMAELEHGRWNIERLRDGWRPGPRDDAKKTHNCLAPWEELSDGPDGVKRYDRDAVRTFPKILAKVGFEVYRNSGTKTFPKLKRKG